VVCRASRAAYANIPRFRVRNIGSVRESRAGDQLHLCPPGAGKHGRLILCKYILRPPLANDRLRILDNENVRLELKKPWSDGTACVDLAPLAFIARLAALVPPPQRHTVRYFGVLSSHATSRSDVVPSPAAPADDKGKPKNTSKCISWSELLRRTFGIEILCTKCKSQLRLIAEARGRAFLCVLLGKFHKSCPALPRRH
jgi:hypothetical protein